MLDIEYTLPTQSVQININSKGLTLNLNFKYVST